MSAWQFSDCSDEEDIDFDFDLSTVSNKKENKIIPSIVNIEATPTYDVTHDVSTTYDDDGWISDGDHYTSGHGSEQRVNNECLVERIREVWIDHKKEVTKGLITFMHSLFEEHNDVYSLIITAVSRVGRTRPQPNSIPRIILSEFKNWTSLHHSKGHLSLKCSAEHQSQVIAILERCHHVLMNPLVDVFDLYHANRQEMIEMIRQLLESHRHTDALSYITKLNLQEEFDIKELLLPLVAMDKINLIENYLTPYPKLQHEFLKYIEELYSVPDKLDTVKCQLRKEGIKFSVSDKLTRSQLEKLTIRLINLFNLPSVNYPQLFERKAISTLNYLLNKKYTEHVLSDNDVFEAAVQGRPALQYHLITELVCYNDLPLAAHYTALFNVPSDHIPLALKDFMKENSSPQKFLSNEMYLARNITKQINTILVDRSTDDKEYYSLKIPLSKIHFVDSKDSFMLCREKLERFGNVIGIDAEWRFAVCNNGIERLSLLQLAVSDAIFLLDVINLPKILPQSLIKEFVNAIFGSENILKLGYQVEGDICMLSKTWPFASHYLSSPKRVVDLKYMSELIFEQEAPLSPSPLPLITIVEVPGFPKQYISNYGRGSHWVPSSPPPSPGGLNTVQYNGGSDHKTATGLSLLVKKCFGKPLDKRQQLSDWDRRPLYNQQVKYAALDAYCLLDVYTHLKSLIKDDDNTPTEPTLDYMKDQLKSERQKRKLKKKQMSTE